MNVNSSELISMTAKLERLNKTAYPSAVKNTLNNAAFEMKKTTLLTSAKKNFNTVRSSSLYRRRGFILVNMASGFDVNRLSSTVGFSDASDPKIRNVVEGLRKHEFGGMIDDGSRYLKDTRSGKNYQNKVRVSNYYDKNKVVSGRSQRRGTRKSKFVARMFRSKMENKPFFMNSMKGNFLVQTKRISRDKNGNVKSRLSFLMMSRKESPVKIKKNKFVSKAGDMEARNIPTYYQQNAEFQFKKALR
jgi:hypothetical protein